MLQCTGGMAQINVPLPLGVSELIKIYTTPGVFQKSTGQLQLYVVVPGRDSVSKSCVSCSDFKELDTSVAAVNALAGIFKRPKPLSSLPRTRGHEIGSAEAPNRTGHSVGLRDASTEDLFVPK